MKLELVHIKGIERDLSDHIFLQNGETEITDNDEKDKIFLSYSEDFPTRTNVFKGDYLTINKNKNKIFIKVSVKDNRNVDLYVIYVFEIDNLDEKTIEYVILLIQKYANEYKRKIIDEENTLETLRKELLKIHNKETNKRYIPAGSIGLGIILILITYFSAKNIPLLLLGALMIVSGIVIKFKK